MRLHHSDLEDLRIRMCYKPKGFDTIEKAALHHFTGVVHRDMTSARIQV